MIKVIRIYCIVKVIIWLLIVINSVLTKIKDQLKLYVKVKTILTHSHQGHHVNVVVTITYFNYYNNKCYSTVDVNDVINLTIYLFIHIYIIK